MTRRPLAEPPPEAATERPAELDSPPAVERIPEPVSSSTPHSGREETPEDEPSAPQADLRFPVPESLGETATKGAGSGWRELLSSLVAVTEGLHLASDLKRGLEEAARRVARLVPYDTLGVLLLDERGRDLRFFVALGYPDDVAEHWRLGLGQGVVGTVAKTGRPLLVADVQSEPRYLNAGEGIATELAVPMVSRGRVMGVLEVGSRQPGAYTEEHQGLLETVAGLLATAVEGARLYQATREQARMLSLLHEASRELTAILDRDRLLERVADLVHRLIDYDVFTVMLWNPEAHRLEPVLARFRDGLDVGRIEPMPLGLGICGTAAALRKAIRVPNVTLDPRYLACSHPVEVRSELAIPLLFEDRLLGVVDLESSEFDAFSARDEELLSTLGSSLAIALENARLYAKVRASERRMESDLAMAREIQKRLLPRASPLLPGLQVGVGYQPARELGGDFYDLLPFGDDRVAFAVGDVSGKGSPAALYGALAVGMLREHALHSTCCDPGVILSELNEKLHQLGLGNRFLAMAFGIFDARTSTVSLASSGLPHPWRLGPGGVVEPVLVEGVPLGLLPRRTYEVATLELAPGHGLVVASDGIEEARRGDDEEFGRERVRSVLTRLAGDPAAEIAEGLLADVQRFTGSEDPSDDRTVLVLKGR